MKKFIALLMIVMCVFTLAACKGAPGAYMLDTSDKANYFDGELGDLLGDFGEGAYAEDDTYGGVLTGVAVVRLLDFTGDGKNELYVAYADGTKPYANRQVVYGFDNGPKNLIYDEMAASYDENYVESSVPEEITSKSSASSVAPCVWLYTDNTGRSYIVTGDDMSNVAEYHTYKGDGVYAFVKEFEELGGKELAGTYEKIELTGVSEAEAEKLFDINKEVFESISAVKK